MIAAKQVRKSTPRGAHAWATLGMLFQGHPHGLDTAQTLLDAKVRTWIEYSWVLILKIFEDC